LQEAKADCCSRSAIKKAGGYLGAEGVQVMKRRYIITLFFLFLATSAFAAEGRIEVASIDKEHSPRKYRPPLVIEKNEYYEVRGNSEKDLRHQMCQNGCTWDDGRKYDSVTNWYWTWEYGTEHASPACSADDFSVTIEVTFRLPKWVRTDEAPRPLVDKWDGYMKHLTLHEQGHRDRAVDAAAEFSRAVARLPRSLSCADRDQQVRTLSSEIMAQLNTAQQEYDADTSHGATQGALFP
jgi:predicted secreted Zn-dependent protease